MSHNPIRESSPESMHSPSGSQSLSFKNKIARAIFNLDATVGIGNTIGIALLLVIAGWLLRSVVHFPSSFAKEDQQALQRQLQWPVYINETFDDDQVHTDANWDLGSESYDDFDIYRELVDGQYFIWVDFWTSDCCMKAYHLVTYEAVADFVLSVDLTKQEGGKPPTYGIVFHHQDASNFCILAYNDVGNLLLDVWYQNKRETIFVASNLDKIIQPFESNHLVLSVEDGHGLILINDQYIGQFDDDRIPRGRLGFAIGGPYDDYAAAISIDNIVLRTPE